MVAGNYTTIYIYKSITVFLWTSTRCSSPDRLSRTRCPKATELARETSASRSFYRKVRADELRRLWVHLESSGRPLRRGVRSEASDLQRGRARLGGQARAGGDGKHRVIIEKPQEFRTPGEVPRRRRLQGVKVTRYGGDPYGAVPEWYALR